MQARRLRYREKNPGAIFVTKPNQEFFLSFADHLIIELKDRLVHNEPLLCTQMMSFKIQNPASEKLKKRFYIVKMKRL